MPGVMHDDAPPLADLLPWSVAPLRLGRAWPMAPDAASLKARWDALLRAGAAERAKLFGSTGRRDPETAVPHLPGRPTGTGRLSRESGPCPEPVRILHGPFDEQWLIPDHRLIDQARPELWRVADAAQVFLVEQGRVPNAADGPPVLATRLLPDGHSPAGRPGRIRPLYRRPGGREPNLAPGLLPLLDEVLGTRPAAAEVPAWVLATASAEGRGGTVVPLTRRPELWSRGTELGRSMLRLLVRGGERPRLPGGRRPYVRAPLPPRPAELAYDRAEEALLVDGGRIAPVPAGAWDFRVSGVRVLELWFARRTGSASAEGGLAALGPATWPQTRTSELLELITVLALLAELDPARRELAEELASDPAGRLGARELRRAGVLPVPASARRPASVLDHHEEGPEGQFALL
ncbi:type ISP restriction/modification enzyme [Streptomyces sp. NPDC058045]|uniref:type ISP restriction/modification enzyme n=1 Tax=Streptomyces sp. NPDC058045 TaxID=3346311 RepID=UPI0036E49499